MDTLAIISGIANHPNIAMETASTAPNIPTINPFLPSDWMHITVHGKMAAVLFCLVQLVDAQRSKLPVSFSTLDHIFKKSYCLLMGVSHIDF